MSEIDIADTLAYYAEVLAAIEDDDEPETQQGILDLEREVRETAPLRGAANRLML